MSQKKLKFSQDVMHIILDLCQLAFNLKNDNDIENLFGITPAQFKMIIEKISGELPDFIFDLPEKKLEEIESIFAREFIFFSSARKRNRSTL